MRQKQNQDQLGLMSTDFNSSNTRKGREYELLVVEDLIDRGYTIIPINKRIRSIGCSVDYIAEKDGILEYGEAKGGLSAKVNTGARRTDNVKKAIANGALLKARYPDTKYVVYFSTEPLENSASELMLNAAIEYNIINEVRYLEY